MGETPSRGQSTSQGETGRIARLVHVAMEARRHLSAPCRGLDIGTGNGIVRRAVEKATGIGWYGIDASGPRPRLDHYNLATLFDVLEHAAPDETPLAEARRSLVDGGVLAVTLPSRWWLFETHALPPFNRLPFFNWGPWRHWLRRNIGRNVKCYTLNQAETIVNGAGFLVVRSGYLAAPLDKFIGGNMIRDHHETRVPFFATNVFVIGIKKKTKPVTVTRREDPHD